MADAISKPGADGHWYKDAIIYQLNVKAFRDTNASGIGDFRGLVEKMDYLEDLGITTIWLQPFYPSPQKDDGYDIADYFSIHPDYGTIRDFRTFLKAAHTRGIRVITELVLNHTSDQHSWFQRARKAAPGSNQRDFYVWSETPDRYADARIIFTDFETSNWSWDPVAKAYFWHRFYSHQPDLNFENLQVRKMMFRMVDFWLRMGVDGLRLDAVPYLYEREGTNCENLPETFAILRELRSYIESKYDERMLLAEANQWPEDAVSYFGAGDICHTAFHFPLMPRMYIALQMEDRFPIIDILEQTPGIPEPCQWIIFLRNHDELTLEMVTDEERDYMYRVYARDRRARINLGIRRRLAPLLSNNRRMIELLNVLLFSLPGTPVIYYGDEIGMGDNYYLGDRNGVRTPMQWSPGKNAGFSDANPQKLYLPVIIDPEYHYEAVNIETQQANTASLLWWMKRIIATRKGFKCLSRGSLRFLFPENPKILAFMRQHGDETVLVVGNLSQFSQAVELELADFAGTVPVEIFSRNRFPVITRSPYPLTLGGYGYYWFLLEKQAVGVTLEGEHEYPELKSSRSWKQFPEGIPLKILEGELLPRFLKRSRWFGEKSIPVRRLRIQEHMVLSVDSTVSHLLIVEISYQEGNAKKYMLPVSFASQENAQTILSEYPQSIIAKLIFRETEGYLYDALFEPAFAKAILGLIGRTKKIKGLNGELAGTHSRKLKSLIDERGLDLIPRILKAEQSNSAVVFENVFFLKLYRGLEEGTNPDIEMVRFLTEKAGYPYIPPYAGSITYKSADSEQISVALLQGYVPNQGDAWTYTLDAIRRCFDRVLAEKPVLFRTEKRKTVTEPADLDSIDPLISDYIGNFFLEMMGLLGNRTGELHRSLASTDEDPAFRPEPFSTLYMRSLYQSMRSQTRKAVLLLKKNLEHLPEGIRNEARKIADMEEEMLRRQQGLIGKKMQGRKIRTHGDFHLGQVLFTGKDFLIIDFEGEPARPMSERRLKRSPLRDVAGMLRSFHYAVHSVFMERSESRPEDVTELTAWIKLWFETVSGVFLSSYLRSIETASILPQREEDFDMLLQAFLLEKGIYELMYELNNRPDWVGIPIHGILHLLEMDT